MSGPGGVEFLVFFGPMFFLGILLLFSFILMLLFRFLKNEKLEKIFQQGLITCFICLGIVGFLFIVYATIPETGCSDPRLFALEKSLDKRIQDEKEAFAILKNLEPPPSYTKQEWTPALWEIKLANISTQGGKTVQAWMLRYEWGVTPEGEIYKGLACVCRGSLHWRRCTWIGR